MASSLSAALLTFIYLVLSAGVIRARRSKGISMGYGKDNEIIGIVSAHNNFSNYAPLFLVLLYMTEVRGDIPSILLAVLGLAFVLGRLLHLVAFAGQKMNFRLRVVGMLLTFTPLGLLALAQAFYFVQAL